MFHLDDPKFVGGQLVLYGSRLLDHDTVSQNEVTEVYVARQSTFARNLIV